MVVRGLGGGHVCEGGCDGDRDTFVRVLLLTGACASWSSGCAFL